MSYLPSILIESKSVVDVELGADGKLLYINNFHEELSKLPVTSRIIRLLVWM